MPPVYNQLALGSCTANGNAAVFERQEIAQGEPAITPSRLFVYYCERELEGTVASDSGAQVRTGIKVLASQGAPPESVWPYDIGSFAVKPPAEAYAQAKKHEAISYQRVLTGGPGAPLRTAIAEHGPVVFGFVVPERFESPTWNPATEALDLPLPGEQYLGGHCVVATGYDFSRTMFPFDVFEVRNSWGEEWGNGGYFWMQAAWLAQPQLGLSSDFWLIKRVS
ncbi:MAG: C1 family peptidase [Patescibacteria group bacterium]|nr:C1 family peptidase [Patescibacteria group bacterium]